MKRRSAESVASLVNELVSLPSGESADRIAKDSRFRSLRVARRLIEISIAAVPERPEDSARFATMALDLLDRLPAGATISSSYVRAFCSLGNAYRLMGDLLRAGQELDLAAIEVTLKEDSALQLRTYAILRWEQSRCDEAVGLLIRAERLFRDSGLVQEASATVQLLILFHAALGEASDAVALFRLLGPAASRAGSPRADPTARPWLSARAALTVAFLLADRPDLARPEEPLEAFALGDSLIPYVLDQDELLQLEWLKARAKGRMGHSEEAAGTLLALRQRLCPAGIREIDFLLLTLDLIALRVAARQGTEDLLEDLETTSESTPDLPPLADALRLWLASERSVSAPWGMAGSMGLLLRRRFRAYGLSITRLPFS